MVPNESVSMRLFTTSRDRPKSATCRERLVLCSSEGSQGTNCLSKMATVHAPQSLAAMKSAPEQRLVTAFSQCSRGRSASALDHLQTAVCRKSVLQLQVSDQVNVRVHVAGDLGTLMSKPQGEVAEAAMSTLPRHRSPWMTPCDSRCTQLHSSAHERHGRPHLLM